MIDKSSGKTAYAIMSFGGFLGMGTRHHAIPWQRLTFDKRQGVFVVDIDRAELEGAPAYDPEDISAWEDPTYGRQIDNYYGRPRV